jgi:hypothetical protein
MDHFWRKAVVLSTLIQAAPDVERKTLAIQEFAAFLASASSERNQSPPEWMYHALALSRYSREISKEEPNWTRLDAGLAIAWKVSGIPNK